MATVSFTTTRPTPITTDRLLWAGALTAVFAITTSMLIYYAAESVTDLSGFSLLNPVSISVSTAFAAIVATVIYGLLGRYNTTPTDTFRKITTGVLLASFVPVFGLMLGIGGFAITVGTVVTLVLMHSVAAMAIFGMLTTIVRDH